MIAVLIAALVLQTCVQAYNIRMTSIDRKSMLNAIMAKSTYEFQTLQSVDRPKRAKKAAPIQDDAGIAYGL